VREIVAMRRNRQPLEWPSCGSVFKRPPGDFAGRLIETAGLKGLSHGGAEVPQKHANFIVNRGGAKAQDVLAIIKKVKKRVHEEFGVFLEREVILIGFTEDELEGT
jgi:UDP-N-acetylmuramate dehydrogenase